ncbi:hypothetical protein [Streptomyces sp. enrichment culture]|uniref:hypothetical protein n=1 Tax=Streptomyces sp. enrichment culture TaxID=1795815 RepID=UPI003F56C1CE
MDAGDEGTGTDRSRFDPVMFGIGTAGRAEPAGLLRAAGVASVAGVRTAPGSRRDPGLFAAAVDEAPAQVADERTAVMYGGGVWWRRHRLLADVAAPAPGRS